ncbi:MAG: hypothetical protein QM724_05810 [Flavobacteriales bacterium]
MFVRPAIVLLFLLVAGMAHAQDHVVVRMFESNVKKTSFIHIAYDDGRSEVIDLESWPQIPSNHGAIVEAAQKNDQTLVGVIKRLHDEGFILTQSSATSDIARSTLMVFERKR